MDDPVLVPLPFEALRGWAAADLAPAFQAFRRSAERLLSGAVRAGSLAVAPDAFLAAASAALTSSPASARAFFEAHFAPAAIRPAIRPVGEGARGFLTGYFEPVLPASRVRGPRFAVPLHARPDDLVAVTAANRPAGIDPELSFARRLADGTLAEHPDRAAIARGALDGRGLEIVFLEDAVDAFFVQVQGSARLRLAEGGEIRVGYAGKSGHAYTSIGRVLVQAGELALEEADMAGLRRWLAAHPARRRGVLDANRSYVFFQERPVGEGDGGPVGAAQVPLTPMGSIALDHRFHTYGMPVFVNAPGLVLGGAPFAGLLVAQDTGSAILGPARGDLFVGSGEAAGALAGTIRHAADFYALLPKGLAPRRAR